MSDKVKTIYSQGEKEKEAQKAKKPGVIKTGAEKPRVKISGPGAKVAATILLMLAMVGSLFAQPGVIAQPGTQASVFTNRLLTTIAASGVTNRIYYTNASSPYAAFGNTNLIHIRTNATSGRWEWHTDWATRIATNINNRPTGTWQTAVASPVTYGYTRYEPRSPQTIADAPSSTAPNPGFALVQEDGSLTNPIVSPSASFTTLSAVNVSGNGGGLTNVPGTLTNFAATATRINTNILYITGSYSNGINTAPFYWNVLGSTYTNANGFGLDGQFGPDYWITNAVPDYIHKSSYEGRLDVWEENGGAIGTWTNVPYSVTGWRPVISYLTDYPYGLSGTLALFGRNITNAYGTEWTPGSALSDTLLYPSIVASSQDITFSGPYHSIFSSRDVLIRGQRISVISSAAVDAICTNSDYTIISTESGIVRNGQGVAALIACGSFGDYSGGTHYVNIAAAAWTNAYMNFSAMLGGYTGNSSTLNNMESSVAINAGGSTNNLIHSVVIGEYMVSSNLASSTMIGRRHGGINATNVYLLGEGLATTSNNVVKVGFTGWHVLIQTNRFQLVSNNVPYNVVLAP